MKLINVTIWKELALNREAWNYLAGTAKTYKVLES
jgi:hypothetical protein